MSEPTVNHHPETLPDASTAPIEATLGWRSGRPAPDLKLEFCGVERPLEMLGALASLGWNVPTIPSPPKTAIEWVPDAAAGTDYTIRPWRVKEFALKADPSWDRDAASVIAVHTLAILQRADAIVDVPEDLLRELTGEAPAPAAPAAAPGAAGEALAPAGAPQVIAIGPAAIPVAGFGASPAIGGGRNRIESIWSDSDAPLGDEAHRSVIVAESVYAWQVRYRATPVAVGPGQTLLVAAVPGGSADDKKLDKLVSMLGGSMQIADLIPLDPSGEAGALVYGVLPAKSADIAASTLRLKAKAAIVRVEAD